MRSLAAAILATALAAGAQTRDDADRLLKAARNIELVDGNLNAAIKQYGAIVAKYAKTDRTVTATALVRMADCYRRMGDAESRRIYEQVVREYADQKEAVATARERLRPGGGATRMTGTLVWSGPEASGDGISRDGRYLSYTDWETGDLAIREIATGQNRRLTDTKQKKGERQRRQAEGSTISPDGRTVAYTWFDGDNRSRTELRLASLTGNPNPRHLYDNPAADWISAADWSPDGKWLAVLIEFNNGRDLLGLISVPEGKLRVLKTGKWRSNIWSYFSPDGKYLAYDTPASESGPERSLFVMTVDDAREMPVAPHRGRLILMGWSPDGTRILFASDRHGAMALWSIGFTAGKPQGEPELIKADLGEVWPLGITRSGALYYGASTGRINTRIHMAAFDFSTGPPSAMSDSPDTGNRTPARCGPATGSISPISPSANGPGTRPMCS